MENLWAQSVDMGAGQRQPVVYMADPVNSVSEQHAATEEQPPNPEADADLQVKSLLAEIDTVALQLKRFARMVRSHGQRGTSGMSVLEILAGCGPRTVPQIGRLRSTSRQNIQVVVNRLTREGCAELAANPGHQRSSLVQITESGRAALESMRACESRLVRKLREQLARQELTAGLGFLRRVRSLLSQPQTQAKHAQSAERGGQKGRPLGKRKRRPGGRRATAAESALSPGAEEETAVNGLPFNLL